MLQDEPQDLVAWHSGMFSKFPSLMCLMVVAFHHLDCIQVPWYLEEVDHVAPHNSEGIGQHI